MKNNTTIHTSKCSDSDSGYQVAGGYTIQPLTTSIDIKTERRLIASWHTSGLSDVQIRKMLMLYFGEPAWMNLQKLYDCNRFSQIATGLRFRSRQEFVELLLRCAGFGFIWKNKEEPHTGKNLLAFYTPIWHVCDEKDMVNEQKVAERRLVVVGQHSAKQFPFGRDVPLHIDAWHELEVAVRHLTGIGLHIFRPHQTASHTCAEEEFTPNLVHTSIEAIVIILIVARGHIERGGLSGIDVVGVALVADERSLKSCV